MPDPLTAPPGTALEAPVLPVPGGDVARVGEGVAALAALGAKADEHERAARSPRTRRQYAADWAHFTRWCELAGCSALPAGVQTLRSYLADLEAARTPAGKASYQPATMARRLAAIAAVHRDAGLVSATRDPRVLVVLTGITRARRPTRHQMTPLLLADLRAILSGLDHCSWPGGVRATRDTFVLLAGFAGALRRSELAALTCADLAWYPTDGLHVRIRASKTDQEGEGATVVLPFGTHPQTCPPCGWLRWARLQLAARVSRRALMTAVFATEPWAQWTHLCGAPTPPSTADDDPAAGAARVDTAGAAAAARGVLTELGAGAPVVCTVGKAGTPSGRPMSGDGLHVTVKRLATGAGLAGPIGFHSLRAGFVTQARRAGSGTRAVRRQTRHSSDAMVENYDRDHAPLLGNAVLDLGL